jgi:SsrA-binding protein
VTDFARNKKALHDFAIEETYEAGIQLTGPEVKSVREGRANLKESYARVRDGEVFLIGAHISPYANARQERQLPTRDRKLLLHRKEIDRLIGKSQEEGKTLIPLKLYSKNGIVKLQIAVASRKRQYDKRREIAKKTADREIERAMKERHQRYSDLRSKSRESARWLRQLVSTLRLRLRLLALQHVVSIRRHGRRTRPPRAAVPLARTERE